MVKKTVLSLIIATALITGCAGPAKQLDAEALLPEIDVIQVKRIPMKL